MRAAAALLVLLGLATCSRADTPDAAALLEQHCYMCHAPELISQQRLTPAQWEKTVTKMIAWGSPLPPEHAAPLVSFLASHYTTGTPAPEPVRVALSVALQQVRSTGAVGGVGARGAAVYRTACASCHGVDARGGPVGPALTGRPVLAQPDRWNAVVRTGRRTMPGFASLSDTMLSDVQAWVLQQSTGSRP